MISYRLEYFGLHRVLLFFFSDPWSVARGAWSVWRGVGRIERERVGKSLRVWCFLGKEEKKNPPTQFSPNLFGAVIMAVVSGSEFESLLSMLER